jgi:hypothetical protein
MKRAAVSFVVAVLAVLAGAADLKPLDFTDLTKWNSLRTPTLSRDGKWLAYAQAPIEGDGVLYVKKTDGALERKVDRGSAPRFTKDGKYVVLTIVPAKADVDKAKKEKKPALKNQWAVLALESGATTPIEGATVVKMPEDDESWMAVQFEPAKDKKDYALEIRRPGQAPTVRLEGVTDYAIAKNGAGMAVAFTEKEGLVWVEAANGKKTTIDGTKGTYSGMTIGEKTGDVAYVFEAPAEKDKPKPKPVVKLWKKAGKVVDLPLEGIGKGLALSAKPAPRFSKNGKRLFFNTSKPTKDEAKPADPSDDAAVLDVWHWNDPEIQPAQILKAASEKNRNYSAAWDLGANRVVQLETPEMENVATLANGDCDFALGYDDREYAVSGTWGEGGRDVYAVDLKTGAKRLIAKKLDRGVETSNTGRYAVWYEPNVKGFMLFEPAKEQAPRLVTAGITTDLWNDLSDTPGDPGAYGLVGWTKDDAQVLIYDKYDLWAVDPTGKAKPRCVTGGFGRRWQVVLRRVVLNPEEEFIDSAKPLLLKGEDEQTKADGFYECAFGSAAPNKLRVEDRNFGPPIKAREADVMVVSRQSFEEYPDLYVTDSSFKELKRMSDANPQQAEYQWGSEELVEWTSADGVKLQGILIKPAGFDRTRKYPMILSFYERTAWTFHRYHVPSPMGGAGANASFYSSRGYLVFMPDITYLVGYPGKGAVSAVVSGALSLVQRGFVDPKRMAIVGHSWGGYEVAYLVTQTNLFRCAVAGATVSNMTSAYGGIRYGSGVLRQFQYEKGQSRIGGSLWEGPLKYIDNSPIFWVDRIQTPLLLLHNDKDGAVPWTQSIELYGALRRYRKPVWLVNYNGEDHGIGKMPNRKDWSIRQTQFFDHYLKDAPAPVWMTDGIPAVDKGKDFGLELKGKG